MKKEATMMVNDTGLNNMVPSTVQIKNKHVETELSAPQIVQISVGSAPSLQQLSGSTRALSATHHNSM